MCSISPRRVQNVAPTGIELAPTWTYLSSDWPPCPRLHCRSALCRLARLLTTPQVTRYGASTRRHRIPTLLMSDVFHWSTPHSYTFATLAVWASMVLRYAGKSNPPAISFRSGKLNPPSVHSHHPPPSSRITLQVLFKRGNVKQKIKKLDTRNISCHIKSPLAAGLPRVHVDLLPDTCRASPPGEFTAQQWAVFFCPRPEKITKLA